MVAVAAMQVCQGDFLPRVDFDSLIFTLKLDAGRCCLGFRLGISGLIAQNDAEARTHTSSLWHVEWPRTEGFVPHLVWKAKLAPTFRTQETEGSAWISCPFWTQEVRVP